MTSGTIPTALAAQRAELERLYHAAVAAVEPGDAVRRVLRACGSDLEIAGVAVPAKSQLGVLAVGKAAGAMAAAVEALAGPRIREGLVVTRDGLAHSLRRHRHMEAGHPVPDARSHRAAGEALALVSSLSEDDVLLVLLSGGTSALLGSPPDGVEQVEVVELTRQLLASGADIAEVNAVRKHVSRVSGGRLAQATSAKRIEVLVVSDVPEDRIDVIGSGPFAPDPTHYEDACRILRDRGIWDQLSSGVRRHLEKGVMEEAGRASLSHAPGAQSVYHHVVASNADALAAAVACGETSAERVISLGEVLHGEARDAAARLASRARSAARGEGGRRPVCFVGGGETTVTLQGDGRGGRNQELALAAAIALEGVSDVALLAAGTDGSDGVTDAAGAFVDGGTVARGAARGVDARQSLNRNDSYGFFEREGGLFQTGPTGTNVMDLVFVWVGGDAG